LNSIEAIQSKGIWVKLAKYILKPLAWILAILLLTWAAVWIYVVVNEGQLRQRVSKAIKKITHGDVQIRRLSVSLFRTFPLLSLQLEDVVLKDSVTAFAHKDFLKASDIYLRISVPKMITGKSPIGKILIRNGEMNVVSDSLGNTNQYIFSTKQEKRPPQELAIPDLELRNISGVYKNPQRAKDYSAFIRVLKCSAKDNHGVLSIRLSIRALVRNLSFNTIRGAFLKEKIIEGKVRAIYERATKNLSVHNVRLYLDNHPFFFSGKFNLDKNNGDFNLAITTNNVMFTHASSLVTEPIRKAVDQFSVTEPVNFSVNLSGKTLFRYIPLVQVRMDIHNNKVITPKGMFEDCSFEGFFSNEAVKGKQRDDINSFLLFRNFTGRWENIKLHSKQIKITNLIKPFLECDVASNVDMKTLDDLTDSKTFKFLKGRTSFNILFKGSIIGDSSASNINGQINIVDASVKYVPRNLLLSNCDGVLKFVNNDLFVNKLNTSVGNTRLFMNGTAANFLTLLNISPEKLVLQWKINSPALHLDDFKPLLSSTPVQKSEPPPKKSMIAQTSSKIDKMFSEGDMYISLESPSMDYKTFKARDVKARVVFTSTDVKMEEVSLDHAGGSMLVKGNMKNRAQQNPVFLQVHMNRMDIPQLFQAFDNFGQDAITHSNMKGKLSADVFFNTVITDKAKLVTQSSDGKINFIVENGELVNFTPIKEIGSKAFKKQDFSHVRFADLKNTLELKGTTFIINKMDIRSTALNFSVEGVYDVKKGTDMSIKLPFRNLLKSQAKTDISDRGKPARGPGLRLRAKTGDDGKLKVSWDPLRLAVKNKEDVKDSASQKN
jgi:hypothetical protein